MFILNYCHGADTGGQSWRTKQAFDRYSDHYYRSCVRKVNYIRYPRDMPFREGAQALRHADVLHLNETFIGHPGKRRPIVMHYHGSHFRRRIPDKLAELRRWGARGVVSTLDLLVAEDLEWLPSPHDMDLLPTYRKPIDDGVLRIGHAPTNRAVKSTKELIEAVERLGKETPVELVMIERLTWNQTQEIKGTVDVVFDQVTLGYGNNSVEAWGMGIPVIAGAHPQTLETMWATFGELPFYQATEDTIYEALVAMTDPETRALWGKQGRAFAERVHGYQAVVDQLEAIYEQIAA